MTALLLGAANAPCQSLPDSLDVYSGQIAFRYSSPAPAISGSYSVCTVVALISVTERVSSCTSSPQVSVMICSPPSAL